jgi:endoglucanase
LTYSHNYARWYGGIIGQGGPTNAQYASLLSQLASKYAGTPQVAFDIMNEPHDLNIGTWAGTVQAAVTAIRNAGATNHTILIPGMDYASAGAFPYNSGPSLLGVSNPDGSKTGLIFNVHQYLDADHTGTHSNCVYNNINEAFAGLASFLRKNGRAAMITETGGGPTDASCMQNFCAQNDYIK